jgi:hypothetical protein
VIQEFSHAEAFVVDDAIAIANADAFVRYAFLIVGQLNVAGDPDVREFLKRYFIQGQNGAAQSGYLDALNTVWGQMSIQAAAAAAPKPEEKKEADKPAPVDNTLMYVAIGISATALFAVLITLLLPARNVL